MLGAPSKEYSLETDPRVFERLTDADRKDFIMFATKNNYSKSEPDKIYTIKGVETLDLGQRKTEKLVKIRDCNNTL